MMKNNMLEDALSMCETEEQREKVIIEAKRITASLEPMVAYLNASIKNELDLKTILESMHTAKKNKQDG